MIVTPVTVNADTPETRRSIPIHQRTAFGILCIVITKSNVTFRINISIGYLVVLKKNVEEMRVNRKRRAVTSTAGNGVFLHNSNRYLTV
jgi:hypothetical protein